MFAAQFLTLRSSALQGHQRGAPDPRWSGPSPVYLYVSMKNSIRTFLFPGMGATCAMYENLYRVNSDIVGCDWPKGNTFKSFSDLAKCCIQEYGITSNDVVAGSSMGGMVACEMFIELQCRGLVLIGSCSDPRSVPLHKLAWLGSYAVNDRLLNISAQSVPWGMRLKSSIT